MRVLDLFSCGGGASMGYHKAGFEVVGVDIKKKRDYPFTQLKYDVLELFKDKPLEWFREFDLIHASPPCQKFSRASRGASWGEVSQVDLIEPVRDFLKTLNVPYVIENVEGSPLHNPVKLCGSMFGLKVRRHRLFETSWVWSSEYECRHKYQGKPIGIYGSMGDTVKGVCSITGKTVYGGSTAKTIEEGRAAMGINWLNWGDLKESIPPIYTYSVAVDFKRWRSL